VIVPLWRSRTRIGTHSATCAGTARPFGREARVHRRSDERHHTGAAHDREWWDGYADSMERGFITGLVMIGTVGATTA
jgi:hypothetical protein